MPMRIETTVGARATASCSHRARSIGGGVAADAPVEEREAEVRPPGAGERRDDARVPVPEARRVGAVAAPVGDGVAREQDAVVGLQERHGGTLA